MEKVIINLKWDDLGLKTDGECLNNLRFADDILFLSETDDQMIEELNRESLKIDLKMNMKKTKVKFDNQLARQEIMIANEKLERVEGYTYLGQTVGAKPAHEKEIKRRIFKEWNAFGKQVDIMNRNFTPL